MYGHVGSFLSTEGLDKYLIMLVCMCIGKSAQQKVNNHARACVIMHFSIAHHAGSEEEWLPQEDDRAADPPQPYTKPMQYHSNSLTKLCNNV